MVQIKYGDSDKTKNYTPQNSQISVSAQGGEATVTVKRDAAPVYNEQKKIGKGNTTKFDVTSGNQYQIRLDSYEGSGYITAI